MVRTSSAHSISAAKSPDISGSTISTEPCITWPFEPSMVMRSPALSVTPPTERVRAA